MKMKNMLIGGMSLALVACLSVGATLAYFTASDEEVVNTFQFVTDGDGDGKYITVTLTEDDPQETITNNPKYGDAKATGDEKGYTYTDVVPGQTLPKEPEVTVATEVPSYIYLRVTDKDADGEGTAQGVEAIITEAAAANWTKLDDATITNPDGSKSTVYYYNTTVDKDDTAPLAALFTEVQVPNVDPSGLSDLNDVKIEVAAIQSAGFASASDAYTEGGVAGIFTSWKTGAGQQ